MAVGHFHLNKMFVVAEAESEMLEGKFVQMDRLTENLSLYYSVKTYQ